MVFCIYAQSIWLFEKICVDTDVRLTTDDKLNSVLYSL